MMCHRVWQLCRALTASFPEKADRWVAGYLPPPLLALFEQLPVFEKSHAFDVARCALTALAARAAASTPVRHASGDQLTLVRAALLHDIGKGPVTVWGKVKAVLARTPARIHAQRGAEMVRSLGFPREALLIAHHHDGLCPACGLPKDAESLREVLECLQFADKRS